MVKFINRLTGNTMWVAEDRVEEYKARGHRIALSETAPEPAPKPKKQTKKKKQGDEA